MALKDRFASALAVRAGITIAQAEKAIDETVALIKTKVPPHIGQALDDLVASENGISHAIFLGSPASKVDVAPVIISEPSQQASPQAWTGPVVASLVKKSLWQRFLAYWGSGK
jgi:hypothetical protein